MRYPYLIILITLIILIFLVILIILIILIILMWGDVDPYDQPDRKISVFLLLLLLLLTGASQWID